MASSLRSCIGRTPILKGMQEKAILIVDDDESMLRALDKVLEGEGWVVRCARWVDEAMEHLKDRDNQFDLVITDMRMPFVNGKTVLNAVKTAFPAVPVIIITAFGSPELKSECLHQGAAAFLEKPLNTPQLLAAIEGVLAHTESH